MAIHLDWEQSSIDEDDVLHVPLRYSGRELAPLQRIVEQLESEHSERSWSSVEVDPEEIRVGGVRAGHTDRKALQLHLEEAVERAGRQAISIKEDLDRRREEPDPDASPPEEERSELADQFRKPPPAPK